MVSMWGTLLMRILILCVFFASCYLHESIHLPSTASHEVISTTNISQAKDSGQHKPVWVLSTADHLRIRFTFREFQFNSTDFLEIGDGAEVSDVSRLALFRGTTLPSTVTSLTSAAWLRVSSSAFSARPPDINTTISAETLEVTTLVKGLSLNISSPGFPGNYPNNAFVSWYVQAPDYSAVSIVFGSFDTEQHDYLHISTGEKEEMGDFVNRGHPWNHCAGDRSDAFLPQMSFTSRGSRVKIVFSSDNTLTRGGFYLELQAVKYNISATGQIASCSSELIVTIGTSQSTSITQELDKGNGASLPTTTEGKPTQSISEAGDWMGVAVALAVGLLVFIACVLSGILLRWIYKHHFLCHFRAGGSSFVRVSPPLGVPQATGSATTRPMPRLPFYQLETLDKTLQPARDPCRLSSPGSSHRGMTNGSHLYEAPDDWVTERVGSETTERPTGAGMGAARRSDKAYDKVPDPLAARSVVSWIKGMANATGDGEMTSTPHPSEVGQHQEAADSSEYVNDDWFTRGGVEVCSDSPAKACSDTSDDRVRKNRAAKTLSCEYVNDCFVRGGAEVCSVSPTKARSDMSNEWEETHGVTAKRVAAHVHHQGVSSTESVDAGSTNGSINSCSSLPSRPCPELPQRDGEDNVDYVRSVSMTQLSSHHHDDAKDAVSSNSYPGQCRISQETIDDEATTLTPDRNQTSRAGSGQSLSITQLSSHHHDDAKDAVSSNGSPRQCGISQETIDDEATSLTPDRNHTSHAGNGQSLSIPQLSSHHHDDAKDAVSSNSYPGQYGISQETINDEATSLTPDRNQTSRTGNGQSLSITQLSSHHHDDAKDAASSNGYPGQCRISQETIDDEDTSLTPDRNKTCSAGNGQYPLRTTSDGSNNDIRPSNKTAISTNEADDCVEAGWSVETIAVETPEDSHEHDARHPHSLCASDSPPLLPARRQGRDHIQHTYFKPPVS